MKRAGMRFTKVALLVALAVLASACTSLDWAQWGNSPLHQGWSTSEVFIRPSNVASLAQKWSLNLGAYINASPIVAAGIPVNGTPTDIIYVGTEHGEFYAINTAGSVIWHRNLGNISRPDCPDTPDGLFGISAPAAFDRGRNAVYVEGGDGYVYALDPATGATKSGWPVQLTALPNTEVVYSGPTLYGSHLYFEIASHCDLAPYRGRITDINPDTHTVAHVYYPNGATGSYGAGIWGWGGATIDKNTGNVFIATGNATTPPQNGAWSESVIELSANLDFIAAHNPGTLMGDDDFGSTPVAFTAPGCPPQVVAEQKNGNVYLYNQATLASGPVQTTSVIDPPDPVTGPHEPGLLGHPFYYPATNSIYIITPRAKPDGSTVHGVNAYTIDANCRMVKSWQTPVNTVLASTGMIAGDILWVTGGYAGKLYALDARTGALLWNSGTTSTGGVYPSPAIVNGMVYSVGYDMMIHAYGLP